MAVADVVTRLRAAAPWGQILVIDDGSEDDTPRILASIRHPDLFVIRRRIENAVDRHMYFAQRRSQQAFQLQVGGEFATVLRTCDVVRDIEAGLR